MGESSNPVSISIPKARSVNQEKHTNRFVLFEHKLAISEYEQKLSLNEY